MSAEREHIGAFGLRGLIVWLAIFGGALYALEQIARGRRCRCLPTLCRPGCRWTFGCEAPSPRSRYSNLCFSGYLGSVWAWTCMSVVLRITVDMVDAATRGAAWVGGLRSASDWITLPIFRRIVDASLAGLILARVATQSPAVEAAPLTAAAVVVDGPIVDRPTSGGVAPALGSAGRRQRPGRVLWPTARTN